MSVISVAQRLSVLDPTISKSVKSVAGTMTDAVETLVGASSCSRLFLDGGSHMGESVDAFLKGSFYRCAKLRM